MISLNFHGPHCALMSSHLKKSFFRLNDLQCVQQMAKAPVAPGEL